MKYYLQEYKGLWYGSYLDKGIYSKNGHVWIISDSQGMYNNVMYFNGDNLRLDECLEIFKKER